MRPLHRKLRKEPTRILLRHADLGPDCDQCVADEWRGLSALGHAQAREVALRLGGMPIVRILAAPTPWCRQTVIPLAYELSLKIEPCHLLARGTNSAVLLRFLEEAETENAVLCTDRETLLGVFAQLAVTGSRLVDGVVDMEMAAAWQLCAVDGGPARLRLLRAVAEARESAVGHQEAYQQPLGEFHLDLHQDFYREQAS